MLSSLSRLTLIVVALFWFGSATAQFASYFATNLTKISSPFDPGVTIAYKDPNGVCTTAFQDQQQYAGWVSVPGPYPTNIFFWFIAARQPTSSLTIWLNGGPGSSSMFGLFTETGPCQVVEQGANRLGTVARDWGWDRASNMLFIDQPNQVGFSYDTPTNGSMDFLSTFQTTPATPLPPDRPPTVFMNGTFSSSNVSDTANTTETAALAIWHMLQGFLGTFPQFNPPQNSSVGVNLFAESYGGRYGPVFAETWKQQNAKRRNGTRYNTSLEINLSSLGIMNGCVDDLIQGPSYSSMLVNNSYGLQLASSVQVAYNNATFFQAGGCQDLIYTCRNLTADLDPTNTGGVDEVNSACARATGVCNDQLLSLYSDLDRSPYDIAHKQPDAFPSSYYIEYLNTRAVQDALGAVVNYTDTSWNVYSAFASTGDWERESMVPKLAALLTSGVRVGLVYGDRDYICNWMGGEAVSMALASAAGGSYAANFPAAGYAPIIVNDSYIGGVVRQYANLSFSRIYQAGHFVPAYQPETAFQVFARIILGNSVSTGESVNLTSYNTTGPANATSSLSLPSSPSPTCFVRALNDSCPPDSISSILKNQGVIINGVWYAASSDWPGMTSTTSTSTATSSTSATATLTGLFTATATPSNGASKTEPRVASPFLLGLVAGILGVTIV